MLTLGNINSGLALYIIQMFINHMSKRCMKIAIIVHNLVNVERTWIFCNDIHEREGYSLFEKQALLIGHGRYS